MFHKKRKKGKSSLAFLAIASLVFTSALIFWSFLFFYPFWFGKPFISPLASSKAIKDSGIETLLKKAKINFSNVEIASDSSYLVFLVDNGSVLISPNKSLDLQVRSLQIILSRLTIEGKRFKSLDFRFDKPVISF